MTWWYLSFADETGFLGASIVEAPDDSPASVGIAALHAHARGCNPGGEVLGFPLAGLDDVKDQPMEPYRVYSREEMDALQMEPVSVEAEDFEYDHGFVCDDDNARLRPS